MTTVYSTWYRAVYIYFASAVTYMNIVVCRYDRPNYLVKGKVAWDFFDKVDMVEKVLYL